MIHVLTVHWKDDRWIDPQLRYLKEYLTESYKVYSFLNHLKRDHAKKFDYSSTEDIPEHAIKLNLLADIASCNADSEKDWLMFIDGDAFPIGDIVSFVKRKLINYPLIAIKRIENAVDIQPHPSFCVTTVGFWKMIAGDWKRGHQWVSDNGEKTTDVGGNLLGILENKKIEWFPMLRSNKRERHKLWFGVYEDLVYHHGAGFRRPFSRVDFKDHDLPYRVSRWNLLGRLRQRIVLERIVKANSKLSEEVFQSIVNDPHFYRWFQQRDVQGECNG